MSVALKVSDIIKTPFTKRPIFVEGMVVGSGLTMLSGKPKAGKSLLALNMGVSIAMGIPALGSRKTKKSRVLYIMFEDWLDDANERLTSMNHCYGDRILDKGFSDDLMIVTREKTAPPYMEFIRKCVADEAPEFVILDTLGRILAENHVQEKDYTSVYSFMNDLSDMMVKGNVKSSMVLHHAKKSQYGKSDEIDEFDAILGSTAFRASTEGQIMVSKKPDYRRYLSVEARSMEEWTQEFYFNPKTKVCTLATEKQLQYESPYREIILNILGKGNRKMKTIDIYMEAHRDKKFKSTSGNHDALRKEAANMYDKGLISGGNNEGGYFISEEVIIETRINPNYATPLEVSYELEDNEE